MMIGYARVSTDGQDLDAQQVALKAAGAERIFAEKISGAVTDRKQLAKALAALGNEDILPMRLRQALLNLLSNANKFTERGTITVHARQAQENGRDWITIAVADTGIGMTAEQMGKLFRNSPRPIPPLRANTVALASASRSANGFVG
jgi:signal transduction histidine kinase